MAQRNQTDVTDKNLDRLADFLTNELTQPALATQIPDGAHIFHGAYNDIALTQANLKMSAITLMGMTLGLREKAPVIMLFESKPGQHVVINLATADRIRKLQTFAEMFQEQSQQEILSEINELMAA